MDPQTLPQREVSKLLSGTVVPRPIAWVSTISVDGQPNLAPFSYFNVVCPNPPTLLFCTGVRGIEPPQKDTYTNVVATGEFVVNFVSEHLAEAMNITAIEAPPDVNEFERASLTAVPSAKVKPPRVAESLAHFECRLLETIAIGEGAGGGNIVIGTVVHMHFDDRVFREGNYIDLEAFRPIGRLSGSAYCHVQDSFSLQRPRSELRP
ncbi:MAG: flavin reductase family protein [Anaerolineae bacterium]|nr:flavin reductase family protein [Anaerolineae bacterium]